jgi:hypothetical protein
MWLLTQEGNIRFKCVYIWRQKLQSTTGFSLHFIYVKREARKFVSIYFRKADDGDDGDSVDDSIQFKYLFIYMITQQTKGQL